MICPENDKLGLKLKILKFHGIQLTFIFKAALNSKLKSDCIIKSVELKYGYDFYFYNQKPETFLVVEFTLPWLRKIVTHRSPYS